MITYQYRIYPTREQQIKLWQHSCSMNALYNYFLDQRIKNYAAGIKTTQTIQQKELVVLKKQDPRLKGIYSQVLQQVTLRIQRAYENFFRRVKLGETPGFPKFRSADRFFNITYPQEPFKLNLTSKNGSFTTKIYGEIKIHRHRPFEGTAVQVTITAKNNQWFLQIVSETVDSTTPSNSKEVGMDVGLGDLAVLTDGIKIKNQNHFKYFDKEISKLQNRRSKCKKGSRQYRFYSKTIKRLYGEKTRKTVDFHHKASKSLSSNYDTIFAEDLNVKQMSEGSITNLNKAIRNTGLSQFINFLKYKTKKLVLVNPRNTSKTCNKCGHIHKELKLSQRKIKCQGCGVKFDRDENAAKNILCLGQAMMAMPSYVGSMTIQEALTFR